MKESPIIFSGPMVKAIICVKKTQTRRPVKGRLVVDWLDQFLPEFVADPANHLCPYGYAGDRLWVREAFLVDRYDGSTQYRASHPSPDLPKWRPSIHMPRERSRLNLHINAVRIERLQDISEADATAEGIQPAQIEPGAIHYADGCRGAYAVLWDSLNAKRGQGWATNPWVWVIDFRIAA